MTASETRQGTWGRRSHLLGGSEIGRCPVRIHHDRYTEAEPIEDPLRERVLAMGLDFERTIVDMLLRTHPSIADLRSLPIGQRAEATTAAMRDRAPIVLGGRLESGDSRMVGMPDLLVLLDSGYAPVEIKHHKVIGTSGRPAGSSDLAELTPPDETTVRFRSFRKRDLYQTAHYRALLLEAGFGARSAVAGVIGTDEPIGCVWVDLDEGEPSAMDEYRLQAAEAQHAIAHGELHPDTPLHQPWNHRECERCDWAPLCTAQLAAVDDPTLLRGIGREERTELAAVGITTATDVARLDITNDLIDGAIVLQARARAANRLLRADVDLPELPASPTEVDFDIETIGGRVYLAGMHITERGQSHFTYVADWTGTEAGERDLVSALFDRFAKWPKDAVLFHWTEYEPRILTEAGERHGLSIDGYDSVEDWFNQHAIDLCAWSRTNLVSPAGFGLKVIAPLCGFAWRDDDPGGLQSEIWFEALQSGDGAMQQRILEYNEDDVRAQLAVREFIRAQDSGDGPGSGIPSVHEPVPTG